MYSVTGRAVVKGYKHLNEQLCYKNNVKVTEIPVPSSLVMAMQSSTDNFFFFRGGMISGNLTNFGCLVSFLRMHF